MRRAWPGEFAFQLVSLFVAALAVHAVYVTLVRPRADALLAAEVVAMQSDPGYVQQRSAWVIIRDFEQEACFILMLWAGAIMGYKGWTARREQRLLEMDLVPLAAGTRILPEDAREYARQIEALPPESRRLLLPRSLLSALSRFGATRSIQDVSTTAEGVA